MGNSKLSPNFPIKFRWQLVVTGISLLAIACSILFQVKPILSPELPLLIVIVVGGIPSVIEILLKLFKGDLKGVEKHISKALYDDGAVIIERAN